jgi:hypothetical protein
MNGHDRTQPSSQQYATPQCDSVLDESKQAPAQIRASADSCGVVAPGFSPACRPESRRYRHCSAVLRAGGGSMASSHQLDDSRDDAHEAAMTRGAIKVLERLEARERRIALRHGAGVGATSGGDPEELPVGLARQFSTLPPFHPSTFPGFFISNRPTNRPANRPVNRQRGSITRGHHQLTTNRGRSI